MSNTKKIVKLPENSRPVKPNKVKKVSVKVVDPSGLPFVDEVTPNVDPHVLPLVEEEQDFTLTEAEPLEPKKRKSRAKPKPTKEEVLKMLSDSSKELKQIIIDLKDDEMLLSSMPLKKVKELVQETLKNLDEDQIEIDEKIEELQSITLSESQVE